MQNVLGMILTVILMFQTLFGALGQKYTVVENLRYGEAPRDLVTLYIPNSAYEREYNGCVLVIHGGSWTGGEKEAMAPHCKELAMKGYIAATMSYSLCEQNAVSDVTVYTMLDEIGACIGAIKQYGEEHGLNITKMATSGYSAGGHISMLYSYTRAQEAPVELAFTANRVGPADMTTAAWGSGAYRMASMLTGVEITDEMIASGEGDRLCREISPVYYVDENTIPSIFAYAGNDMLVTGGNREAMVRVFRDTFGEDDARYRYILYPLSNHGMLLDPASEACYDKAVDDYCKLYFGY